MAQNDTLIIASAELLYRAESLTCNAITAGLGFDYDKVQNFQTETEGFHRYFTSPKVYNTFLAKHGDSRPYQENGPKGCDVSKVSAYLAGRDAGFYTIGQKHEIENAFLLEALNRQARICFVGKRIPHPLMAKYAEGFNEVRSASTFGLGYLTKKDRFGEPIGLPILKSMDVARQHFKMDAKNTKTFYISGENSAFVTGDEEYMHFVDESLLFDVDFGKRTIGYLNAHKVYQPSGFVLKKVTPNVGMKVLASEKSATKLANNILDRLSV